MRLLRLGQREARADPDLECPVRDSVQDVIGAFFELSSLRSVVRE